MHWAPYGPSAVLIHFAEKAGEAAYKKCCALVAELEKHAPSFLKEFTPAYTTLLVEFDLRSGMKLEEAATSIVKQLERVPKARERNSRPKEIPVVYDGPDLARVAEFNKLSVSQVIKLHAGTVYTVYFLGFSPGFPYLSELPHKLHAPRLNNPRPRVPAGSVAIGGEHTGIYSVETAGGWNIIGHTAQRLFISDGAGEDETSAFFLKQGDRVRFIPSKS